MLGRLLSCVTMNLVCVFTLQVWAAEGRCRYMELWL